MPDARFHLIGHLQSNKAKPAAELFHVIQTVDTPKLARRLDAVGKPLDVMIEVKLSHEEAKAGADPEAVPGLIDAIRACPNLRLTGLMTMPPWSDDPELSRPYFRRLRELGAQRGRLRSLHGHVARFRSCHRGRRHSYPGGYRAFRQTPQSRDHRLLFAATARSYRRRGLQRGAACWPCDSDVAVEVNRDGDVNLYHIGNNQLHASIYSARSIDPA